MPPHYTGQKLPIVGPWIGKFGRVADIMATPCDVDPGVWVLAFFTGAPTALFSLFKPDPFDMVTERFGGGHKKRGRRRFRWDEMVQLPKPTKGGMSWVFFRVGSWAERLGWYMLIADVAFEWAVNWSSMAYQWSGCPDPNASWGWLACDRSNISINDGLWAGYERTNHHGDITTDDYRVIALTQMVASPYLELETWPATGIYPNADFVEFRVVDLNSGWQSDPIVPDYPNGASSFKFQNVWRDYGGTGAMPRYALHIKSDGKYWGMKVKLGLNGDAGRGIKFDP